MIKESSVSGSSLDRVLAYATCREALVAQNELHREIVVLIWLVFTEMLVFVICCGGGNEACQFVF